MQIVRFDFKVPEYTVWRAQRLKSVAPALRPDHCVRIVAAIYYRMQEDTPLAVRRFIFDDVDEPREGFPLLCHLLGFWRAELHDNGRMLMVDIPSNNDVLELALRYPARGGGYHLQ